MAKPSLRAARKNFIENRSSNQDPSGNGVDVSGGIDVSGINQSDINIGSESKMMSMRVKYGDIQLIRQYEKPGWDSVMMKEIPGGDDPTLQTFRMRVRVDGNGYARSGANAEIVSNPAEVVFNNSKAKWAQVREEDRIINFEGSYALRPFDPDQFWSKDPSLQFLRADVAVGGAIAWENSDSVSTGMQYRADFLNELLIWAKGASGSFVKSLQLPFNYKNFFDSTFFGGENSKNPAATWVSEIHGSLKSGFDAITGQAGTSTRGLFLDTFWRYVNNLGGLDRVVGAHLFVLIPTTQKFYNQMLFIKSKTSLLDNIFPYTDLINNVSWYQDAGRTFKPALDITYGFIPTSNPETDKNETDPFYRPMGEQGSLEWRGGCPLGPAYNEIIWANQFPEITASLQS